MNQKYFIDGLVLTFLLFITGCNKSEKEVKTVLTFQPGDSTVVISIKNNSRHKLYFPLDSNFVFDTKVWFIDRDGFRTFWGEDLLLTIQDQNIRNDDFKSIEDSGITSLKRDTLSLTTTIYPTDLDSIYVYELDKTFSPEYKGSGYRSHFKYLKSASDKSLSPSEYSSIKKGEELVYQRHLEFMKSKQVYFLNPGDEVVNKICIADWLKNIARERPSQYYYQLAFVYDLKFTGDTYGFGLEYPACVLDYKLFPGRLKSDTLYISLKH